VLQHIFPVAKAELELAQKLDQLGVYPTDANLEGGLFACFPNRLVRFRLSAVDHIFNAGRLDPTVGDELLQAEPGNFPPDGVEAGDGHHFRSVVYYDVYPG
jgi:hypothetical protein